MVKLKGITWDHDRGYAPLVAASEAFNQQHPEIKIEWHKRSLQAFADRPLNVIAQEYDLLIIDHPHVGEASEKGSIVPLNHDEYKAHALALQEKYIGPSYQSYILGNDLWAVPIDAACQVACYRADLLSHLPISWEDVLALAGQRRVLWPLKPVDAIDSFFTLCANMGYPVAASRETFLHRLTAERTLAVMQSIARKLPQACLSQNPIDVLEIMSSDDRYCYCPLLFGYTNYSRTGYRQHLVSFADMPSFNQTHAGSIIGGAGIAVSAQSAHIREATDFAWFVASDEIQSGLYVSHAGQPAHASAWRSETADALTNGFFGNTLSTMDNSWLRPRYNGFLYLVDVGGDVINNFLRGKGSIESVISTLEQLYQESFSGNKSYNFE